ncbi:hypothetical protein Ciccas_008450 [Cichlidogyrus casuarinus]|uniref:Acetyl-coenzyme A transporter 1 n=1 Tax=Cichlidogyrus casuarinus TaxID=1844966 RepID=A0ABD2Q0F3_9PLAT
METEVPETVIESSDKQRCHVLFKDAYNICLLIFLYFLQGIPLGLASSIPYMIQGSKSTAGYETLANFSLVFWPFSMKLAWAPFVDSFYWKKFGRRKSWLIPVQYAIGIDLIFISYYFSYWLARPADDPWGPIGGAGDIKTISLTIAFFFLTFLAATQDIVVDGWALTMLSRENVGWASTCNTVGQPLGSIVAFVIFIALESPTFTNDYIRSTPIPGQGIISAKVGFFKSETGQHSIDEDTPRTTTLGKMILRSIKNKKSEKFEIPHSYEFEIKEETHNKSSSKDEKLDNSEVELDLTLVETYSVMFSIIKLKPIMIYIVVQFLIRFSYSCAESLLILKLIEWGASKEKIVLLTFLTLPMQLILPLALAKWSSGNNPLLLCSRMIIPRLFVATFSVPLVYYSYYFRSSELDLSQPIRSITPVPNEIRSVAYEDFNTLTSLQTLNSTDHVRPLKYNFGTEFYMIVLANALLYTAVQYPMYVSQMAFNAKISDPVVGGTYMTLLNTASNLAGMLPQTLMLYFVDPLTSRTCTNVTQLRAAFAWLSITPESVISQRIDPETGSPLQASTIDKLRSLGDSYLSLNATCKPMTGIEACENAGGVCINKTDGFYIEMGICFIVGVLSYVIYLRKKLAYLDQLPKDVFRVKLPIKNQCLPNCPRSKDV